MTDNFLQDLYDALMRAPYDPDDASATLARELHMMAELLKRHKNLVVITPGNTDGEMYEVAEVIDYSAELHPSITVMTR